MVEGPRPDDTKQEQEDDQLTPEEFNKLFGGPAWSRQDEAPIQLESVTRPALTYNAETIDEVRRLRQDNDNPFAEHIEVFSSSPQGQRSYSLESKTEHGGQYTDALIRAMDGTRSIEAAHEQATEDELLQGQPPLSSVQQNETEWTPSAEIVPGRRVLLISGAEESKNDGFSQDTEKMKKVLIEKYGVDPENIIVLDTPDQGEIKQALSTLASEGSDQLLVYYSGHGLLDREDVSKQAQDGVVRQSVMTEKMVPDEIIDSYPDRPNNPQGNEHGSLMLQKEEDGSTATFLHEHTLKDMLNPVSEKFPGGTTIILDSCYSGAFIAQSEPRATELYS